MLSSSSTKLSSLKYTSFFVTWTLWLRFITVGGSWLLVNETGAIINLSWHHFQSLCSKDENVVILFRDCNYFLIWGLTLLIAFVTEHGPSGKVNEDISLKPLYNLHTLFLISTISFVALMNSLVASITSFVIWASNLLALTI